MGLLTASANAAACPNDPRLPTQLPMTPKLYLDEIEAIAAEAEFALEIDHGHAPFQSEVSLHIGEGGATTTYQQAGKLVGISTRIRDSHNRTILACMDLRDLGAYEPKGADLHVRMALGCLEELEQTAINRKRRTLRNFNEDSERESQLSAARVCLDRALDILVKGAPK